MLKEDCTRRLLRVDPDAIIRDDCSGSGVNFELLCDKFHACREGGLLGDRNCAEGEVRVRGICDLKGHFLG